MDWTLLALFTTGAGLCFLVLRTFTFQNGLLRWFAIIFPPLTLLSLTQVPLDIGTSLYHVPLGVAVVWSLVSLIRVVINCVFPRGLPRRVHLLRSVRPLLVLCVQFLVLQAHSHSLRAAKIFASEAAITVQASCDQTGVVPPHINQWPRQDYDGYASFTRFGSSLASWYPIRYSTGKGTYSVEVRIDIDESFTISGGIGRKLEVSYGPYYDYKEVIMENPEELMKFAKNTPKQN